MNARLPLALASFALVTASILAAASGQSPATAPAKKPLTPLTAGDRNLSVHDPSTIVKCKDEYYVYYTGTGVPFAHSKDLVTWVNGPRGGVVTGQRDWVATAVPGNQRNSCWAPDVMKVGDKYFMYYAVSTFGSNISAIALTTSPTLDPTDPTYKWTDEGIIVQSQKADNFNTIDPAIAKDADGGLWLSFGSFWSGIKLIQLDPATGKRIKPDSKMYSLAHTNQIEASYIYHHDKYYYLFVNWGKCCNGANSTYNIRVGRSEKITGPYLDDAGKDMLNGGGKLVLQNEDQFIGPGHAGIIEVNGKEWFSCHYEADNRGRNALAIRPLSWDKENWPVVERVPEVAATATAPAR